MTGQNKSHAVMAQRFEGQDSLDDFPTPPWATRAICNELDLYKLGSVWEPSCNRGYMASVLGEYFTHVFASDIANYGYPDMDFVADFLDHPPLDVDWVITNPPFRLALQFATKALESPFAPKVALLVRTQFLEGVKRYTDLFRPHPPTEVYQFVERVPMVKGAYDPKASTATSYCWIVWRERNNFGGTEMKWISPCRRVLEYDTDGDITLRA